jgi:hypothetical protein
MKRPLRQFCACSVLLLSSTALLHAQAVPGVTGTITSQLSASRYSHSQSLSMQLQAPNFSLNALISSDDLVNFNATTPVVTLYPAATTSDYMPLIIGTDPGENYGTLIYNGVTYTNLQIALNIAGAPAIVADTAPEQQFFYGGSATSVPFSLSGVVTVYALPPTGQYSQPNPPLFVVSFSGGGLYNAAVNGSLPASGSPAVNGQSTYQLLANPIDFSTDTTTQGTWSGVYGGEGYLIANGPSSLPAYAAVSLSQASTYTWASLTSDPRALQNGFGAPARLASSYTGNSFNINIDFTDNNPHPVALYLLDFDNGSRSETLTVKNANTGVTLDTETVSNFQNGVYAIWNLQGNITINVKRASGANPVVSGIFFGPPATILNPNTATPTSTATFYGTNTQYQGTWEGHYGSGGYLIANGPSLTPAAATMNVTGAFPYTWANQTSDPRALQSNPQGTTRIASAYTQYPSTSFKINVDTPVATKEVFNLYLLDWDNEGRAETITLTDLSTGVVLDTETASSFQSGAYYSWLISGSVVVTVTPSGTSSPVVSGIFLN